MTLCMLSLRACVCVSSVEMVLGMNPQMTSSSVVSWPVG